MTIMGSGLASLHKVLKDETRRKVILLLNEKSSLSYTELINTLGIGSTGMPNYHLKVLGDLVIKNEKRQYLLSEKGKLAFRLITEFPVDYQTRRKKWLRRLFGVLIIAQIVYLTFYLTFYFLGLVDFSRLIVAISAFIMATIVVYFGYRMQRTSPSPGSNEEKSRMKIGYTIGGVWLGLAIFFFGGGFLIRGLQELTGKPLLHIIFWTDWYLVFSLLLAPVVGGIIGYHFGKRRSFQKPKWAIWLDERFGF
jgi:hypothetical protein